MGDDLLIVPMEHSALKVFLVLKNIFRYLSVSELGNARLVDRQWNLAAMCELVFRRRQLSTIKLYRFLSNEFCDRDYAWYLDFENTRRTLWTDLYGTCQLLEFRHLHFGYPEKTQDLFKILRSPWLGCVTSLTLSMYSEACKEVVLDWFLPFLPNLQNLSCFIKPEVDFESTLSSLEGLILAQGPKPNNSVEHKPKEQDQDRPSGSAIHSFSVCFEKACSFQWIMLDSFTRLTDLKLEFGDVSALMKCAQALTAGERALLEIEALQITLTHKPNLKEQVEEAELKAEALAIASAKLCNQFRVRQSLNVVSMIPATHFLVFLKELTTTVQKQIKFEIAAPQYKTDEDQHFRDFLNCLIPEIVFKFPNLKDLDLQWLNYYRKADLPFQILSSRPTLDPLGPALQRNVKQLHFSTGAAEIEVFEGNRNVALPIPFLRDVYCQRWIMHLLSSWIQGVVELNVQACAWEDCVEVIDIAHTTLKCVKKLVFRGLADVFRQSMSSVYFFPEVDRSNFPKKWFNGQEVSRQYIGLPGIQSLEVFRVEQFGIQYHPIVESEVAKKMPSLKLIHLDEEFNNVFSSAKCSYKFMYEKHVPCGKVTSTWPSSVKHCKILTNTTDGKGSNSRFRVWNKRLPPSIDNMTS